MSKEQAIRVKKVHRSIGIVLVIFLLVLAVTGIALNHSDDFGLAERAVPAFMAGWYYDNDLSALPGYRASDHYVYAIGSDVYFDDRTAATCIDDLRGAVAIREQVVVLCGADLLLISMQGEVIERLGVVHGVPSGVGRLGRQGSELVLQIGDEARLFDLVALAVEPAPGDVEWQVSATVPNELTSGLLEDVVSWEKFILDVHSGRVLGIGGVWLADLVAALLVLMSISGLVLGRFPHRKETHSPSE